MVLVRAFGWLLLAMALAAVVHDALAWWSDGALRLLTLAGLWARLDLGSLASFQTGVEHYIDPAVWNWVLRPILAIPALLAFIVLGLICLWLGQRPPGGRASTGYVMGSRPPRKRRSQIGL
jgi:hypothetical protein